MNINRTNLSAYGQIVFQLSADELNKEIWLLEEHIKHLKESSDDVHTIDQFREMIKIAKQERDKRAFDKGYI